MCFCQKILMEIDMEKMERHVSTVCSLNRQEEKCPLKPCEGCAWSFAEIERRRKLPLVKLPNGLMGKYVGKTYEPIGESQEK